MSDIFLSYASADRDRAQRIAAVLEAQGWSVWWDRTIPPGSTFDEVIEQALDAARCVVVLWSKTSAASDWVKTEAAEAARRKILVPALIDEVKIPLEFRRVQAANLSAWHGDTQYPELAILFRSIADYLAPRTAGPPRDPPPGPPPRDRAPEPSLEARPEPAQQPSPSRPAGPPDGPRPGRRIGGRVAALVAILLVGGATAAGWLLLRPSLTIPDVVGMPAEKAKAILKDARLEVGREDSREAADAKPGTVLSQRPPAREKARKGQPIDLVVATGALVPVPNVQGRNIEQARTALKGASLVLGTIAAKATEEASPGTILAQQPEAGARVAKDASVDLVVATRATAEVPNVVGESLERARTLLAQAGFTVGRREVKPTEERPSGAVLSQKPTAGERVAKGQEINLVLAGPPPLRVPDLVGLALRDAQARLERLGLITGGIEHAPATERQPGTVLGQRPAAGEQTEKGRPVDLVIAAVPAPAPRPSPSSSPGSRPSGTTVPVPDVTKMSSREAVAAVERVGLLPLIRELEVIRGPAGSVQGQRPPAGTLLEKGKGVSLLIPAEEPRPDAAGNDIRGFIWKDASDTELLLKVIYTYKGDKGSSGVVIYAFAISADGRPLPDIERTEQSVTVGTATVELKLSRKQGAASATSNRLRVCMANKERRVGVFCRTYTFAKVWG